LSSRSAAQSMAYETAPGPLSPISAIFSSHDNPPMLKHPVGTEPLSRGTFVGTVSRLSIR
jgi:hypothetical protein